MPRGNHLMQCASPLDVGESCEADIQRSNELSSHMIPCLFCRFPCPSQSEISYHLNRKHLDLLKVQRFSNPEHDADKDPCIACSLCDFKTFSSILFNKHSEYEHRGVLPKSDKKVVTKSISAKLRMADAFLYSVLCTYDGIKALGSSISENKVVQSKDEALAVPTSITDAKHDFSHVEEMAPVKISCEDELSLPKSCIESDKIREEPLQIEPIISGIECLVASSADIEIDIAGKPLLEDDTLCVQNCSDNMGENHNFVSFMAADEKTFVRDSNIHDMDKGTGNERHLSKVDEDLDVLVDKTNLEGSFICWICFGKFARCMGAEKDLFLKHSKSFCPLAGRGKEKDDHFQSQLLLFCPNDCKFVASESYAFSQHVSKCRRPKVHTERDNFTKIQNSFHSQKQFQSNRLSELFMVNLTRITVPDAQHDSSVVKSMHPLNELSPSLRSTHGKTHRLNYDNCGKQFSRNSDNLRRHKQSNGGENLINCHECGAKMESPKRGDQDEKAVMCHLCEEKFSKVAPQVQNEKSPTTVKSHPCTDCGKWFSHVDKLRSHIAAHAKEKPFKCNQCNKRFKQKSSVLLHQAMHLGRRRFSCDVCKINFYRARSLSSHMACHLESKMKRRSCQICERRFELTSHLKRHMLTHTGEKPFICHLCERRFARKDYLQDHILTHTGEKPHRCDFCDKKFSRSSALKLHLRKRHKGEKTHKCNVCGKRFVDKYHMNSHKKTVHNKEKLRTCDICGKEVVVLAAHKRTHTGEKPYGCQLCGRKFSKTNHVKKHIVSVHTGDRSSL